MKVNMIKRNMFVNKWKNKLKYIKKYSTSTYILILEVDECLYFENQKLNVFIYYDIVIARCIFIIQALRVCINNLNKR